jgi:hypothetical protein
MSIEEGIVAALRQDATVGPLITNGDSPETFRIYHELLPQEVVYPAIAYARSSIDRIMTLSGPANIATVRIAIAVWADTTVEMKTLGAAVKSALDGVTGTLGGTSIQHCYYDSETDLSVFSGDNDDRRITYEFVVWLNET